MKRTLSRRAFIRVISYILAVLIAAGGLTVSAWQRTKKLELYLTNTYQHAFSELTTNIEEINMSLQKGLYATSPAMLSAICTNLSGKATAAQMALGEMPYSHVSLGKTSDFIARVGDYTTALSRRAAAQETLTEVDRQNLRSLSGIATNLSQSLLDLQSDINAGTITLEDLDQAQERLSRKEKKEVTGSSAGDMQSIEQEFPEMPTLVYDGPFSSQLEKQSSLLLKDLPDVSQAQAQVNAAQFLGLQADQLSFSSNGEGKIPTYRFAANAKDGQIYIEITRKGGKVLSSYNSRTVGQSVYTPENCVKIAHEFLEKHGYPSMAENYWTTYHGIVTINFAYNQAGVICYPDLVKVSVAADTGQLMGFEASGYLMSHTARDIPAPKFPEEQARKLVSSDLTILSQDLAVIPTQGKNERLCYEYKCKAKDGRYYIMYINAATGVQEQILVLLEDENGTLAL